MFNFTLGYLSNGNISTQYLTGSYRSNFPDLKEIKSVYSYDKSNRLKKTEKYSTKYYALEGEYSFDPDGNFLTHTRSFNGDNFNYDYYPYTNRLRKVTGTENQFTYDYNGNMTNDYLNENINISYDHRNLITEINRTNPLEDPPTEIKIRYRYDESGNRTRKTIYQSTIENPPPIPGEGDLPPGWIITKDEYYVRDAHGKEIAIYQGYELDFWNVFGMGNEGRIKSTGTNYFYLKDHLGSIRAVLNESNYLVQALDYDAWGYLARSWDTTATRYKFTGKERDNESTYDYFGARYYNSRTAVWQSTDPLFEKHIQFTPYNYVLGNPMILIDPDGMQENVIEFGKNLIDLTLKHPYIAIPIISSTVIKVLPMAAITGMLILVTPANLNKHEYHTKVMVRLDVDIYVLVNPIQEISVIAYLENTADLRLLDKKEVKEYVKEKGYEGDKAVEKFKEDVLKSQNISSEKARSYDIAKDKNSKDYFLKLKPYFKGKEKEIKIDF